MISFLAYILIIVSTRQEVKKNIAIRRLKLNKSNNHEKIFLVIKMNYGAKIKMLRERNGITQKELANFIGIDAKLYSHYETEDRIIPCKHLFMISNYFNISIDYLFGFNEEKEYKGKINKIINEIEIGKRLKEFRKENKLTQSKLATILNTAQPVITNYENGKHLIATPFLYTICKKYHISADYLLGKIDNPKHLK